MVHHRALAVRSLSTVFGHRDSHRIIALRGSSGAAHRLGFVLCNGCRLGKASRQLRQEPPNHADRALAVRAATCGTEPFHSFSNASYTMIAVLGVWTVAVIVVEVVSYLLQHARRSSERRALSSAWRRAPSESRRWQSDRLGPGGLLNGFTDSELRAVGTADRLARETQ